MMRSLRSIAVVAAGTIVLALSAVGVFTQGEVVDPASKPLPNPNPKVVKNWGTLPDNRTWGNTAGIDIGPDGNVWTYDRCGSNTCANSNLDPIFKFDRKTGQALAHFGGGQILFPHGIHVDREGNVWITDGQDNAPAPARGGAGAAAGGGAAGGGAARGGAAADAAPAAGAGRGALPTPNPAATRGHQVFKFSPDGKLLMTIGKPGGAAGTDCCFQPNDIITNAAGEIFISEGHSGGGRIRKFSKDGKLIKSWGEPGSGPGQFNIPHSLAFDSRGRLFVADRANHRLQIFDQEGKFLAEYKQFSRISGLFIDKNDNLYAIDSESSTQRHPNWSTGVRIGKTTEDRVLAFIPPHKTDQPFGAAGEGVAVDPDGNVYGAEGPISRQAAGGGITKYMKQ
jgi:DNA-binding beta-propeller fold protein YncE